MLGQRIKISNSKSQSSIRHQVRKLRAKVRALIPQQICNHFEKRNQQVQKINHRRAQYLNSQNINHELYSNTQNLCSFKQKNSMWKYGSSKIQQWHVTTTDQFKNSLRNFQFQKLTSDQIQRINQDKIYYLGEQNVEAYNNYLKLTKAKLFDLMQSKLELKSMHENLSINKKDDGTLRQGHSVSLWDLNKNSIQKKINKSSLRPPSKQLYNKIAYSTNSTQLNLIDGKVNKNSLTSLKKWNTDGHIPNSQKKQDKINSILQKSSGKNKMQGLKSTFKSAQKRKQEIQHQQKQKRLYQKLKIDMQMAKAETNQRQIKYKQFSKIKQIRDKQKLKHDQVVKRKNILLKKGQIVQINQQLRTIMLHRRENNDFPRSNSCIIQSFVNSQRN